MKFSKLIKKLNGQRPLLAVLIDPDKYNQQVVDLAVDLNVSCFLVGGSALNNGDLTGTVQRIKKSSSLPVILFPGDETQLTGKADGLLLISLLSGRNPDYLIEKHIAAAPIIKKMKLEYLPTAYLLIAGGGVSTTQKISKTKPLDPADLIYITNTAIAAEQLGFKAIYLEGGSGSSQAIPAKIIRAIKRQCSLPIIVGGGINTREKAESAINAGANMIVIGNALENDPSVLKVISSSF